MNIIYLHQYFKTPEEGGAIRSFYLAKALVQAGHQVHMITAHNASNERFATIEGIHVHYLPVYYTNYLGFLGRVYSFLKFNWLAWKKIKWLQHDAELMYVTSTPLTIGILALRAKKKFQLPYYFEVRDLWPEAPIQMGVIRNPLLIRLLRRFEKACYTEADKIIALSPGMRDAIAKTCKGKSISLIPNMADVSYFDLGPKEPALELAFGTQDSFVVAYTGAVGPVNRPTSIVQAAYDCQSSGLDVLFLIAGIGSRLEEMKKAAQEKSLRNMRFLGQLSKERIRELLSVSDAVMISFDDKPVLETNSPNKFFDGIAAGKICIINTDGWLATIIEEEKIGFAYSPDEPGQFVNRLLPFLNDKMVRHNAQSKSRQLAEEFFSREIQVEKFLKLFRREDHLSIRVSDSEAYKRNA